MHGCILSTVATYALVLKHQAINIHSPDWIWPCIGLGSYKNITSIMYTMRNNSALGKIVEGLRLSWQPSLPPVVKRQSIWKPFHCSDDKFHCYITIIVSSVILWSGTIRPFIRLCPSVKCVHNNSKNASQNHFIFGHHAYWNIFVNTNEKQNHSLSDMFTMTQLPICSFFSGVSFTNMV